jgi:hypothetical protein
MQAVLVNQSHVAEESREMAKWQREHPRASEISGCKRRVEFEGTDVRADSKCQADLLQTCRVLTTFAGVFIFDLEWGEGIG